jgi:LacI family transcriptional regulator
LSALKPTVTVRDVARVANVSIATVSRVVNDRYGVNEGTAARVRAAIEELGYESSLVARSLRSRRTHVLGFVTLEFVSWTTEVLQGVTEAVRGSGYDLIVYVNSEVHGKASEGWEQRQVSSLSGTLTDGCLIAAPWTEVRSNRPLVAVDPIHDAQMNAVGAENRQGAILAVEHLLALGHRRIGFIGGRSVLASARAREQGFTQAMKKAGIEVDPSLLGRGDFVPQETLEPARALLDRADPPTAVFAANDEMALELLKVAEHLGYRVPEDLSVVGFDNVPAAAMVTPGLTTVDQHPRHLGYEAAQLLLRLIEQPDQDQQRLSLPTELVVRGSTAPPPRVGTAGPRPMEE